jgi:hypothetical protein
MWIYENDKNNTIRYILGEKGKNPLFCIGINPSTAEPNNLDQTVNRVKSIALHNKFDGWIMFNVYPQRFTDPNRIDNCCDSEIHKKNLSYIKEYLSKNYKPNIWAAWGTIIEKRKFLIDCLVDIYKISQQLKANWIHFGKLTKKGHPRHPLYLSLNSKRYDFNMQKYISFLISQ